MKEKPPLPTSLESLSAKNGGTVEVFKSFSVSINDPCHKVLPVALKRYKMNGPWEEYDMYVVSGDNERRMELHEKPVAILRQLHKEGQKPLLMLRR